MQIPHDSALFRSLDWLYRVLPGSEWRSWVLSFQDVYDLAARKSSWPGISIHSPSESVRSIRAHLVQNEPFFL